MNVCGEGRRGEWVCGEGRRGVGVVGEGRLKRWQYGASDGVAEYLEMLFGGLRNA